MYHSGQFYISSEKNIADANVKRGIKYEVGGFFDVNGDKYDHVIIWEGENEERKRKARRRQQTSLTCALALEWLLLSEVGIRMVFRESSLRREDPQPPKNQLNTHFNTSSR